MSGLAYLVFLAMGVVQLVVMVASLSEWIGSMGGAVVIAFISAGVPLPWFIPTYWYLEGGVPWIYLGAWVTAWSAALAGALLNER